MALNAMGLGFVFTAQHLAAATFRKVQGDLQRVASTSQVAAARIDKSMAAIRAGAMLAGAGTLGLVTAFKFAGAAGEFEMGLAGVAAVSRATTEELKLLEDAAIRAGIETQFSPTEAIEGLRNLTVSGFTARESIEALGPALDLAAGGQISIAQASATTASALRAFGLQADQAAITADKLLRISNATALQAHDLQIALGNVSRGAGLAEQSIDEMLPSIGLIRNTGVDASVAANAASSALIFMSKSAKKFKDIGVSVTDARGKFRPFLDVILETDKALSKRFPNAAERAAKAVKLFGRFGVTAFQAISKQARTGIRTATGEIVRGGKAIAYLREQMATAGGAAAEFREKLLATFEGQKILLQGTLQTAAVVFGKPFARVLKPVVTIVTDTVNAMIRVFKELPDGLQDVISGLFILVSAIAAAAGALLLFKGTLGLIGLTVGGFISLISGAVVSILPFVLAIGAVVGAVILFREAFRRNIGGIADFFNRAVARVRLLWQALVQLFTEGGFSGAVMKELNRAENRGIKAFAINVFLIFNRVKAFVEGIVEGFLATADALEPAFDSLMKAVRAFAQALGLMATGPGSPQENARQFHEFTAAGVTLGETLGQTLAVALRVLAGTIELVAGVVAILRGEFAEVSPTVAFVAKIIVGAFRIAETAVEHFANILKTIFITPAKIGFELLGKVIEGDFVGAWQTMKRVVFEIIGSITRQFGSSFRTIAGIADSIGRIFGKDLGAAKFVEGKIAADLSRLQRRRGIEFEGPTTVAATPGGGLAIGVGTTGAGAVVEAAKAEAMPRGRPGTINLSDESIQQLIDAVGGQPAPVVTIELDGEQIAETTGAATRRLAGRSFAPIPTG